MQKNFWEEKGVNIYICDVDKTLVTLSYHAPAHDYKTNDKTGQNQNQNKQDGGRVVEY